MESEPWLQQSERPKVPGPDGVEAWRVALAACFINFIMAGIGRTSGIFYVKIIDIFHTDRKNASFPFTVRSLTRNLLGPVVGIFGQKYGVRPIIIVGGIIGTLSAAACFYVDDIFWMTVVWGFFNGFGASLITTLTQAAIGEHFVKHKSTASGMGFSGGCFGSFVFPAVFEALLYEYNLNGTFLFIAGIIMHVIPAAMIMKTPTWLKSKRCVQPESILNGNARFPVNVRFENAVKNEERIHEIETIIENRQSCSGVTNNLHENLARYCQEKSSDEQLNCRKLDNDLLWKNRQLVIRLLTDDFKLQIQHLEVNKNGIFSDDNQIIEIQDLFCRIVTDVCNDNKTYERSSISQNFPKANGILHDESPPEKDLPYINGCSALQLSDSMMFSSNPINCLYFHLEKLFEKDRMDIIQPISEDGHEDISKLLDELGYIYILLDNNRKKIHLFPSLGNSIDFDSSQHPNTLCSHIKTAFRLHAKPLFLLICLCRSLHFWIFMPIITTVVDFSRDKGLPGYYGKYTIAALSGGDLIGRLCSGWITDRGFVTLPRYMLISMILQGFSTVFIAIMDSTAFFLIALFIYGLLQGCVFIRLPVLVSVYLGKDEQSIALGCINFFSGVLGFVLPLYIGYFRDTIGSYNGMYYINGAIGAFIGLLWAFEPYFLKLSESRSRCNQQTPV